MTYSLTGRAPGQKPEGKGSNPLMSIATTLD